MDYKEELEEVIHIMYKAWQDCPDCCNNKDILYVLYRHDKISEEEYRRRLQ